MQNYLWNLEQKNVSNYNNIVFLLHMLHASERERERERETMENVNGDMNLVD